jgi:hypothetical protein
MDRVELLAVEGSFMSGECLLLVPHFPVPRPDWRGRSEAVVIVKPDGQKFKTRAQFGVVHFNLAGPASLDQRRRVVVHLPACERDQVPIGSKLLASREIKDELRS